MDIIVWLLRNGDLNKCRFVMKKLNKLINKLQPKLVLKNIFIILSNHFNGQDYIRWCCWMGWMDGSVSMQAMIVLELMLYDHT